jgi:ArsR family transcriptional regulator, arsenate/arsenite/antimonite-responsive transcriptional repressor
MTATEPLKVLDPAACCVPVTQGVLSPEDAERLARSFKALSDPNRVRLLSLIAAQGAGEACVCDLTEFVGLSQPTVSHHMKQLVEAGLVVREQRGKWAYYKVDDAMLTALSDALRNK